MQDVNFIWPQGEDTYISLRYKEGPTASKAVPVDLSGAYSARMSLASPNDPDTLLLTLGSDTGDIVLSTGVNEPNITVKLDKDHTLAGGALPPGPYVYDLFIRHETTLDQIKVVEGTINVKRSITQWA